jgi:hypothetical protein
MKGRVNALIGVITRPPGYGWRSWRWPDETTPRRPSLRVALRTQWASPTSVARSRQNTPRIKAVRLVRRDAFRVIINNVLLVQVGSYQRNAMFSLAILGSGLARLSR